MARSIFQALFRVNQQKSRGKYLEYRRSKHPTFTTKCGDVGPDDCPQARLQEFVRLPYPGGGNGRHKQFLPGATFNRTGPSRDLRERWANSKKRDRGRRDRSVRGDRPAIFLDHLNTCCCTKTGWKFTHTAPTGPGDAPPQRLGGACTARESRNQGIDCGKRPIRKCPWQAGMPHQNRGCVRTVGPPSRPCV